MRALFVFIGQYQQGQQESETFCCKCYSFDFVFVGTFSGMTFQEICINILMLKLLYVAFNFLFSTAKNFFNFTAIEFLCLTFTMT